MRFRPRAYVGGVLPVQTPEGEARLLWCSPRWIVTRYPARRLTGWRVAGIAWVMRIGRIELQRICW